MHKILDRISQIQKEWLLLAALGLICLIYSGFSTPWPKSVGWPEIVIGMLLVAIVAFNGISILQNWKIKEKVTSAFPIYIFGIFAYLLLVPLVTGQIRNWDKVDVVRDVIPLFYMFIPLLIGYLFVQSPIVWRERISILLGLVGVIFSIRYFIDPHGVEINYLYLPQAPEVIFGGIFWLLKAFEGRLKDPMNWLYLLMGVICFVATLMFKQRAEVGLIALAVLIQAVIDKKARKNILILALTTVFLFLVVTQFGDFGKSVQNAITGQWSSLYSKMRIYGFNGKDIELASVAQLVFSESPVFGLGWGAIWKSPIFLNQYVSFTHSWLSYIFLKSGLLGLLMLFVYLFWLVKPVIKILIHYQQKDSAVLPSLIGCLFVLTHGFLFQPTFKTLGFGFVLLVLYLCRFGVSAGKTDTVEVKTTP